MRRLEPTTKEGKRKEEEGREGRGRVKGDNGSVYNRSRMEGEEKRKEKERGGKKRKWRWR